jgi:hypothetical protein
MNAKTHKMKNRTFDSEKGVGVGVLLIKLYDVKA